MEDNPLMLSSKTVPNEKLEILIGNKFKIIFNCDKDLDLHFNVMELY